jgi:hypothetical protein
MKKSPGELQKFFEGPTAEAVLNGGMYVIHSTQNLYQHFCFNRPQHDYKNSLLMLIGRLFPALFQIPNRIYNKLIDVRDVPGIHVRTHASTEQEQRGKLPYITDTLTRCKFHMERSDMPKRLFIASDCALTFDVAKRVFGDSYILMSNEGPIVDSSERTSWTNKIGMERVLIDLLSLSKCQTVYLAWNSNFSRMGALLSPNRTFYCYEHPSVSPDMYKISVNELLSFYKV